MNGSGPAFDFDLAYGEAGERRAETVLRWLVDGDVRVEVKTKRRGDDWLYVETFQDPGGAGTRWKPSGISITGASLWAYVVGNTGIVLVLPADLLRRSIAEGRGKELACEDGDNPTQGRLLRVGRLIRDAHDWIQPTAFS